MKKIILMLICVIPLLSGCSGCVYGIFHPIRQDGPYKGRIIDADTRQPVEGVVVLGTWNKIYPNVAGATHEFYDAQETLTDKNGNFIIPGLGLKIFSNVEEMNVLIFKSGYEYIGTMPWNTLRVDSTMLQKVKWEGDRVVIALKKLTIEERRMKGSPDYPSEATGINIKMMLHEINADRIERGLKPVN